MPNALKLILEIFAALITIITAVFPMSLFVENKTPNVSYNLIIDFSNWAAFLQNSGAVMKVTIFFISEIANAYFFSLFYNRLHQRRWDKVHDIFLCSLVIILTATISILFLNVIIFNNKMSFSRFAGFTTCFLVSLIITVWFFCYEHAVDKTQSPEGTMEQLLGKLGSVLGKKSIHFLIAIYFIFYISILFQYMFPADS